MSTVIESPTGPGLGAGEPQPNTVAVIAAVLTGIAVALCGLLFYWASLLPDSVADVRQLESNSPEQLRLLILGCSTGVLAFIAWVLCFVGLLVPNRTRSLAAVSGVISSVILFGIFGVMVLGAFLNPPAPPGIPPADTESTDAVAPIADQSA